MDTQVTQQAKNLDQLKVLSNTSMQMFQVLLTLITLGWNSSLNLAEWVTEIIQSTELKASFKELLIAKRRGFQGEPAQLIAGLPELNLVGDNTQTAELANMAFFKKVMIGYRKSLNIRVSTYS